MSDTPRVDAQLQLAHPTGQWGSTAMISTDFARQLERELNAAIREMVELRAELNEANERCSRDWRNLVEEMNEYRAQCDQLRVELKEKAEQYGRETDARLLVISQLRADKERLDWLLDIGNGGQWYYWLQERGMSADRATIDAAMQGGKKV